MKVLQKIANSFDRNLSFSVDCLGLQDPRRLPILDIVVWVDWGEEGWRLRHSFFKKECSSDLIVMTRTALSAGCKKQTLFQECMRRLGAMDIHTTADKKKLVLEKFLNSLRPSRYWVPLRRDIVRGALERQDQFEQEFWVGKPRYRDREAITAERPLGEMDGLTHGS